MEHDLESKPGTREYMRRMLNSWQERGMSRVMEQNLTEQAWAIRTKQWLSEIELEEIKRKVNREVGGRNDRYYPAAEEAAQGYHSTNAVQMNKDAIAPHLERQGNGGHEINFQDTEGLAARPKGLLQIIIKKL